mmetsp:Transcript_13507/g.22827  ORF Transcript_13507/g.22827 Transcript_13507/m.22827 type:complete len:217 (-) Transcript_13507:2850-3500(-)
MRVQLQCAHLDTVRQLVHLQSHLQLLLLEVELQLGLLHVAQSAVEARLLLRHLLNLRVQELVFRLQVSDQLVLALHLQLQLLDASPSLSEAVVIFLGETLFVGVGGLEVLVESAVLLGQAVHVVLRLLQRLLQPVQVRLRLGGTVFAPEHLLVEVLFLGSKLLHHLLGLLQVRLQHLLLVRQLLLALLRLRQVSFQRHRIIGQLLRRLLGGPESVL